MSLYHISNPLHFHGISNYSEVCTFMYLLDSFDMWCLSFVIQLLFHCLAESWQLWWMYSHWRLFLWPTQVNLLFSGEREHPLAWLRRERLWPGNHCNHVWLFYMEGKHWCLDGEKNHVVKILRLIFFIGYCLNFTSGMC